MSIDVTDPATAAKLAAARESGWVYGPDGFLLGRFVPLAVEKPVIENEPTIEELERRANDPNARWYTPEEVMDRLRGIDQCGR